MRGGADDPYRILVVDDSDLVRKVVTKLLGSKGYAVTPASSGEEAFAQLLTTSFDAVVTDVVMGALSGIQLCRLVRSDPDMAGIPVVLLTAAYDPRSRFWGAHSGADACIAKEAMNGELLPTVERLLEEHRPSSVSTDSGAPRTDDPLARLSQVLDQLLFQAVVAAEARKLLEPGQDRVLFSQALVRLASQVTDYAYLVVRLDGEGPPSWCVHARAPWPDEPTKEALAALGVHAAEPGAVSLVRSDALAPATGAVAVHAGEKSSFPIVSQGETLGALVAFGGHKRIAMADQATLSLLANELGLVVRSLFLLEQTQRMAHTDGLTGLHNRLRTTEYLVHEVERARRYGSPLTVMLADVDHFKLVNDKFGHIVGDNVLRAVADVLRRGARTTDVAGRWGGEEFLVILPGTDLKGATVAAERLRHMMESEMLPHGVGKVTFSAGLAMFDGKETLEALVGRADGALYRAKQAGRNRIAS